METKDKSVWLLIAFIILAVIAAVVISVIFFSAIEDALAAPDDWSDPQLVYTACTEAVFVWDSYEQINYELDMQGIASVDGVSYPLDMLDNNKVIVHYPQGSQMIDNVIVVTKQGGWLGVIHHPMPVQCYCTAYFPMTIK